MDLNNHTDFHRIDASGMYDAILEMPDHLERAFQAGQELPLVEHADVEAIIIAGMGGSAIAADLLLGCMQEALRIPAVVVRGYQLPQWVSGRQTLVVCSSHSGNTEETLSVFEEACARNCQLMALTTGGRLAQRARENGSIVWQFEHAGQPRAALGLSFGYLLALFERIEAIPRQDEVVSQASSAMRKMIAANAAELPTAKNPAKRYAGQLVSKYPAIFGAEHLAPVARRWKTQINELSKAWCQYEELPEADHNTLAGILNPEEQLLKIFSLFLGSPHYHLRNQQRVELTFTEMMVAGLGTDKIALRGEARFSDMWLHILFGDLMAFYLAILYDIDPTPVTTIESFKAQLG